MLEKALLKISRQSFCSPSDRFYIIKKRNLGPTRYSKIILAVFFSITLIAGTGLHVIPTPKTYAQMPGSSSNEENVCTPEEQVENVCTPEGGLSIEENVCTAEEQEENVCTTEDGLSSEDNVDTKEKQTANGGAPQQADFSCEGNLAEEIKAAQTTLNEARKNSELFIKLQLANGQVKTYPTSNLYWFAKLYEYTTFLEIEKLKSAEHPAMVAHFIPVFFGLYKQAVDSYQKHDNSKIPELWMRHFKTSDTRQISLSGAETSATTGAVAHIQGDLSKAFVMSYKSFTNKYCPANPPPLDYFRTDFFGPVALKIFPESQATIFTEISRVLHTKAPFSPSIETGQLALGIGSKYFGLSMDTVFKWREDAWAKAKMELGK